MRRTLLTLSLGLLLSSMLALPAAAAQRDGQRSDRTPGELERPDVKPGVRPDVRPDVHPQIERLHLECAGRTTDAGRSGASCKWSQATSDAAAGYVLVRTTGDAHGVVFRTNQVTATSFIDANIRVGVEYGYRVAAVNAVGERVGLSAWVRAGVQPPERDVEVLELGCEAVESDDGGQGANCRWSPATNEAAAGYQLWRIVSSGERELVLRTGLDKTSHTDRVADDARYAWYTVLAVDSDSEIVGRSRAVKVTFVDREPPVVDQVDPVDFSGDALRRPLRSTVDWASLRQVIVSQGSLSMMLR
jgi:hypothetical protein